MGIDNAFSELGLVPGATEIEVKAAWRRLVSQWHPDRNSHSGAVDKMQRINHAFRLIARSGFPAAPAPSTADNTPPAPPPPPPESDPHGDNAAEASDTDSAAAAQAPHRDQAISRHIRLTLEEAATGCTRVLRGKLTDTCATCVGSGYQVFKESCSHCQGSGAVRQRSWYGWLGTLCDCEDCQGSGTHSATQPCQNCEGEGKLVVHTYRIAVRIPQGVRNGDRLHVAAQHTGPVTGQLPGDLEIHVEVLAHAFFSLADDGIIRCELPVDGFAWMANRWVEVPTLTGLQRLQLSRDQVSYCLAGQGFPAERRGPRSDHWIEIVPLFPAQPSVDQEILLDQLIATSSDHRLRAWTTRLHAWEQELTNRSR